jgi:hypothetical protein
VDYPYENLDPERFQQFCQALLMKDHPRLQCFPVEQPDGGRDAVSYFVTKQKGDFVAFQVKFVRKSLAEDDPQSWLVGIAKAEAPKVKTLIDLGARQYYLLTNVFGTAHLDAGSIDRMNAVLSSELGLPSMCLWRDDLNRRLDNAWDLKWVYPELMTGPDLIRAIVESGLTEDRQRRSEAVRAFMRDQYEVDKTVRFKQVDLENKLLDLFIDVPIDIQHVAGPNRQLHQAILNRLAYITSTETDEATLPAETQGAPQTARANELTAHREMVGAATALLHPLGQNHLSRIVLEGAPGQGKSTISQYICQVHRMRLLDGADHVAALSSRHRSCPVRIPFRVDLRDLATWLGKRDPFLPRRRMIPRPIGSSP